MSVIQRDQIISEDALKAPAVLATNFQLSIDTLNVLIATSKEYMKLFGQDSTLPKVKKDTEELSAAQLELSKTQNQIVTAMARNNDAYREAQNRLVALKDEMKNTAASQDVTRQFDKQYASLQELERALNSNRVAFAALRGEQARNSIEGQKLLGTIRDQDKAVKDLRGSMGQFQSNVGNYTSVLSGFFDRVGVSGGAAGNALKLAGEAGTSSWGLLLTAVSAAAFAVKQFFTLTPEGELRFKEEAAKVVTQWDITKNKIAEATGKFIEFMQADKEYYAYKEKQRVAYMTPEELATYKNEQKIIAESVELVRRREQLERDELPWIQQRTKQLDLANRLELDARDTQDKTLKGAKDRADAMTKAYNIFLDVRNQDVVFATRQATIDNADIALKAKGRDLRIDELKQIELNYNMSNQVMLSADEGLKRKKKMQDTLHNEFMKQMEDESSKNPFVGYEKDYQEMLDRIKALNQEDAKKPDAGDEEQTGKDAAIYTDHAKGSFEDITTKEQDELRKRWKLEDDDAARKKEKSANEIRLAEVTSSAIVKIVNDQYANQENKLAYNMSLLRENYDEEMRLAGNNHTAQVQLTNEFNAKEKAAQKEMITLKRKQAEFDKLMAAFEIGLKIAQDIAAQNYFGAAEAGVQLIAVEAKPLPSYLKGTEKHKGGLAMVHAKELVEFPGGNMELTTKDSIRSLPYGTKVLSQDDTNKLIAAGAIPSTSGSIIQQSDIAVLSQLRSLVEVTKGNKPIHVDYAKIGNLIYEVRQESNGYMKKLRALTFGSN